MFPPKILKQKKGYYTSIDLPYSAKQVWEQLTNFETYSKWNPLVSSLEGSIKKGGEIRVFIVPLQQFYKATISAYVPQQELSWEGVQWLPSLLTGRHYYQLEAIDAQHTRLHHWEYFTGLASWFLSKKLLHKMETAFVHHNRALYQQLQQGTKQQIVL